MSHLLVQAVIAAGLAVAICVARDPQVLSTLIDKGFEYVATNKIAGGSSPADKVAKLRFRDGSDDLIDNYNSANKLLLSISLDTIGTSVINALRTIVQKEVGAKDLKDRKDLRALIYKASECVKSGLDVAMTVQHKEKPSEVVEAGKAAAKEHYTCANQQ